MPAMFNVARLLTVFATALALPLFAAPEAFEIGPDNKDQLPRGKEADAELSPGDFGGG